MTVETNLPLEARAFLDALAVGESGDDNDMSYRTLFGSTKANPKMFDSFNTFPIWEGVRLRNGSKTHAAGRYQDQPATWRSIVGDHPELRLNDFSPAAQDRGNWALAQDDYRRRTGGLQLIDELRLGHLADVAVDLQLTWTSLSTATFPKRYAAAMQALQAAMVPAPLTQGQLATLSDDQRRSLAADMRRWADVLAPTRDDEPDRTARP